MVSTSLGRFAILAAVLAAAAIARGADGDPPAGKAARPKVEFVKVAGSACLQPLVHAPDALFEDYEAAERRWLEGHYPGYTAKYWNRELKIAITGEGSTESDDVTVVRDTPYLVSPDGQAATVCFDLGVKAPGRKRCDVAALREGNGAPATLIPERSVRYPREEGFS